MSTLQARRGLCGWCGKKGEHPRCPCHSECYCDEQCQIAAWDEHRLRCTFDNKSKKGKFYRGDLVRVTGLQSEKGKEANGRLAEVVSFHKTKGRYCVLYDYDNDDDEAQRVRSVLLKPENLRVHLLATKAAKMGAVRIKSSELMSVVSCKDVKMFVNSILSMSGKKIMDHLRIPKSSNAAYHALSSKEVLFGSPKQRKEMLENGLIDWCLQLFRFPHSLDDSRTLNIIHPYQHVQFLALMLGSDSLGTGQRKRRLLDRFRAETCRKMAALILLVADKKFRLHQKREHWFMLQTSFAHLLGNCLLANEKRMLSILLHKLDPTVTSILLNHVVFLFAVDPTQYLDAKSLLGRKLKQKRDPMKTKILPVLLELLDHENVGEATVTRVGKLKIPAGAKAGCAGRPFASCFLRLCAMVVVEEMQVWDCVMNSGERLVEMIHIMYTSLLRCPKLRPLMGTFDTNIACAKTPEAMMRWAEDLLGHRNLLYLTCLKVV